MQTSGRDNRPPYYPAFLDLRGKRVVVVGGGDVATQKVRGLLLSGADPLVVIAPVASATIRQRAEAFDLTWLARSYTGTDLLDATVVFAATSSQAVNAAVAADARAQRIWVLAVDDVPNCDFIAPATVHRGGVTVAISTSGRSPAMARRTRERLHALLPHYWGDLLEAAATARERMTPEQRRAVSGDTWSEALDGEVETLVSDGFAEAASELLYKRLTAADRQ